MKPVFVLTLLLLILLITVGSSASNASDWSKVSNFAYQLQDIDLEAMGASGFALVIIDYSQDGDDDTAFTAAQISALKNSSGGNKLVLAYLSIGEAENYRYYWQNSWDANDDGVPDSGAPAWLGDSNPEWEGNYKVKYWDSDWQDILFGSSDSYLDKILAAGFDGVYLDIIDAYEYWGPGGDSGLNRSSAEQDMVDLVVAIADYARTTKGYTDFGIFPQNGEELGSHSNYLAVTSGIGREDTWYDGNDAHSASHINTVIEGLDRFTTAGKLVLCTDYVTQSDLIDDFYSKAEAKGYVPYATVRDLDVLTINAGHAPWTPGSSVPTMGLFNSNIVHQAQHKWIR